MAKADNLLAVLWLLRSRRRMTAGQLAEALETTPRTIYRYIDALCVSGVPVVAESGPEGGYSLPDQFRGAPLFFEPTELVALFHASLFAGEAGHPYTGALQTALEKVRRNLAPEQAALVERHTSAFTVEGSRRGGPVGVWLPDQEQAVADCATLTLSYRKVGAEEPELRTVDPYGLSYRNGLWYVAAWCHTREALREFRVDRIHGLSRTGAAFRRPADFSLREQSDDEWIEEQVNQGPLTPVRIAGEPGAIERLCDHWYLRHCLAERTAREALFQVDETGLKHLPGHLLTFGRSIRILEPAGLRAELAALARALTGHHES